MTTRLPRWVCRLACLPLACLPMPAQAHSPLPGVEGFYTGLLHPFSTPAQLLSILSLGLMVARYSGQHYRWLGGAFLLTTLGGLTFDGGAPDAALLATAIAAAGMAALLPGQLLPLAVAIAALGGVLTGMASVPEPGPARDRIITMSGSFVGANLGLLYCMGLLTALTERYRAAWIAIGLRIAAAWTVAVSMLMLALLLAPASAAL